MLVGRFGSDNKAWAPVSMSDLRATRNGQQSAYMLYISLVDRVNTYTLR